MSLVLIVFVLFPVQVVKVDGKVVSFLVKNCGFVVPNWSFLKVVKISNCPS